MIIGNFTYNHESDRYSGEIKTLTLHHKSVSLQPVESKQGNGPDYRVLADGLFELGAAWKRTSKAGSLFLSVTLDDPALARPVSAAMMHEGVTGAILVWSRSKKRKAKAE